MLHRCLFALIVLSAATAARAQLCNCTCDALLGPCQAISRFFMNESGGSPTTPFYLTAGSSTLGSVEVRHANRFSITPGTTLTHVCIALKNPTTSGTTCAGGDPAYIFIATHDATSGLPGGFITTTNFTIDPCVGLAIRHQLVAFSTPQSFPLGADVWVGVGYPTARDNIGHQGVRPRTGGASAVWIALTTPQWFNYDNPSLPPYNGMAPIIRPLEIVRGNGRVEVIPATGLVTDENGATAQFDVFISLAPLTADVIVDLTSSDPGEGVPSPSQLVFTPLNFMIPQTVTVTGQDDPLADGPQPYQIITTVTSADPCYQGAASNDPQITNLDNEASCDLLWTRVITAGPSRRGAHAMAYDGTRQRVVLFGGRDGNPLGDTWEFNPATQIWSPIAVAPGAGPSPRFGHSMTYNPQLGGIMLIGGTDGLTTFDDAWLWNGANWSPLPPHPGGPHAFHAAAPLAAAGDATFSAGGSSGAPFPLADAWTFAPLAGGWSPELPLLPPMSPAPRTAAAMCHFPFTATPLLYGGEDPGSGGGGAQYDDTWDYIPGAWTLRSPPGSPLGFRADHAMAPLDSRSAVVLFGGRSAANPLNNDTWTFGPSLTWTPNLASGPAQRSQHALAAITGSNTILLFGGTDISALGYAGDTWLLSDPAFPSVSISAPGSVTAGTDFTLGATAAGSAAYTFQWFRGPMPLSDGGRISGSQTATLTIANSSLSDSDTYTVVVSNPCTNDVSASVFVDVDCLADFNNSNTVSVQDIFDFLAAYFAGDPRADVNMSGSITVQDIFDFLAAYFTGCP